ncbi:PVC-type heme-binding CxxCH protein [Jiulongibacter sediminis]|uniref:Dehydrogenase n=1 Tax=Jiulongibacter sediminis TaxID=1605367 RepID=A0A0P7BT79_9BACT|nr:PVC-type heme-binding CxxCH protein [Jiulongibacter sediminis]KPM47725.1 dehydrogenase [Jiulongibacter sediminis]
MVLALLSTRLLAQSPDPSIDRDYTLEATMLGYFAKDGTRNPTLKAHKGDVVRITIVNGETMTHDIKMEKLDLKSETLNEKGSQTSITFTAEESDTYFCTVPGHRAAGMVGTFEVVEGSLDAPVISGELPQIDGRTLNLNFENGQLSDWQAIGEAFQNPVFNSVESLYEDGTISGQEGEFFLSSGGTNNYKLTGTLTSKAFKITAPFAAFRVSGGALEDTRVELVLDETNEVIFKSTGQGRATLQPVVADLQSFMDREIFIRIIDNETGTSPIPYIRDDIWAHISFDDFRFYPTRPNFPNELNREDIIVMPPLDPVLNSGLSGPEAAKAMTLPEGFSITLAAAEPEIIRPISFTIDPKGRLWVVEGHTYPVPAPEGEGRDRILILEDTDGNGTLDNRKVFMEGLNLVSGIEVGMGGVWLGAAPYLLFIPVENDKPAGPPQKLLDGWGTHDTHEVLNNLRWGPDGWLYGCHGVFTHSVVGKPGTPENERVKMNGGIWRYHPTRHEFEVFAHGISNPWGIDFNEYGHAFATVCVIPHMFHIIQEGRFRRQAGQHFNPYTYNDIKTIGDHVHYMGDRGPHAGNFRSAAAGGGHAHAGAMIYKGNSWPEQYHDLIFMNNINGARLNNDKLTPSGSGYVASHEKDFLVMNDSWSQWLNFKYDASGSVWAIDWYDKNQCHSPNPDVHDKSLGRIFKITHNNDRWKQEDLTKASDLELVAYQTHPNEWYVRQARTLLQERGGNEIVFGALRKLLHETPETGNKLNALWTLHAIGGLSEKDLVLLMDHENEHIKSWAIQLAAEDQNVERETLKKMEDLAVSDPSPVVRLYLSSALLRLPANQRWKSLEALTQKSEDITDHNLPLMYWYAAEPLAAIDADRALALAESSKFPDHLTYMIQRVGDLKTANAKSALQKLSIKWLQNSDHSHHKELMLIEKLIGEGSK